MAQTREKVRDQPAADGEAALAAEPSVIPLYRRATRLTITPPAIWRKHARLETLQVEELPGQEAGDANTSRLTTRGATVP